MSSETPTLKPRRFWLFAPYVLLGLVGVAWSIWWVYQRGQIETTMDARVKGLAASGYQIQWKTRQISGYPFRYDVSLNDIAVDTPGGWRLETARLEAEASALAPRHIVIVAPAMLNIRRPSGKSLSLKGQALRASLDTADQTLPKISIEGMKLVVAGQGTAFAAIDRFEAHFSPDNTADSARLFVRVDKATATPGTLLADISDGGSVTLGLEGDLSQARALSGASLKTALSQWSKADGMFSIRMGGIEAGRALLSFQPSRLRLDTDGHLKGDLSLTLDAEPQDALTAAGEIGVLPHETAHAASSAAELGALFGNAKASLTLTFKDGQTFAGPLPIGPAPRFN